jgi:hypothetical protein
MFNKFCDETMNDVLSYPIREVDSSPKYEAVIIEPRKHKYFEYVCKNILRFTNSQWGLHVYHGTENEEFVKEKLKDVPNVIYSNLQVSNLNIRQYNRLLTSVSFHESVGSDIYLLFQTDSIMLREGIEEFVKYAYIGAPWSNKTVWKWERRVGNGGFSIRNKQVMVDICKHFGKVSTNEDLYFSSAFYSQQPYSTLIPNFETALTFSVEQISYDNPLAVHQYLHNVTNKHLMERYKKAFKYQSNQPINQI